MKVRWGVLSTAKIGVKIVIPAMQQCEHAEVPAIASRGLKNAEEVAAQLNLRTAYGSYEELLADPNIDAIYNPLPNHLHVPWSVKALRAGKHVLCEKPIALTESEAQKMLSVAQELPHLKVMEAFMYRHHPQWQRARELVVSGKIGEPWTIQSFFSYNNLDPDNIRNVAELGGGGLLDIGCYCISLSRFIFAREPQRVAGVMEYDPQFKIDRLASGILDFGIGTSTFTCATQLAPYQRVTIFGTKGRIEIEIPFNAPTQKKCRLWIYQGTECEEIILDVCDQYAEQCEQFSLAILEDKKVAYPLEDAVANMKVVDSIVRSAEQETWV